MDLFFSFLFFLAQIAGVTSIIHAISTLARLKGLTTTPVALPIAIPCAVVAVIVYNLVVYPILLDPLRKYPLVHTNDIRILLPVTDVPRGKNALQWAKQYPEADAIRVSVRKTTQVLVPMSSEAIRDVLSTNQNDFVKPVAGRNYLSRLLGYGLILTEGATHARQRKHLTSSFKIQNIRALHDLMSSKTDLMLERIEEECRTSGKVDICQWASRVTLDIIGPALMSKEFDSLSVRHQPINDAFARLTAPSSGQAFLFILSLFLPKWALGLIPTRTNREIKTDTATIRRDCERSLDMFMAAGDEKGRSEHAEILASVIKDPLASRTEVVDEMITFLGAGHETTATSIAWATHLLTLPENEHIQQLLRDEVRSNPDCVSSSTALESLPWLNAVCEETLRLFPPVTTTARKAIRNTTIAGTRVPQGTILVLFPWANNRNPRYWGHEDAERFLPQRWIDKRADQTLRVNKHGGADSNFCGMTFLHGNRSCIGKDFAKAELRLILARFFSTFRVRRLPGDNGYVNPVGSITIKPEGGLYVSVERVDS